MPERGPELKFRSPKPTKNPAPVSAAYTKRAFEKNQIIHHPKKSKLESFGARVPSTSASRRGSIQRTRRDGRDPPGHGRARARMASTTTSTTTGSRLELAHHEMFSKSRPLALTHDQWAMLTDGRRRDGKIDGVMNGDGSLTVGTRDIPLPGPYHSFTPLTTVCGRLGSQPLTEPATPVRLSPRACLRSTARATFPCRCAGCARSGRERVHGLFGSSDWHVRCDAMPAAAGERARCTR